MYKIFIVNDSNRKLYSQRHKQIIPKNKEKTKFENIYYKRFTLIMVNIASHLIKDLWRSKNMFFNKEKGGYIKTHPKPTLHKIKVMRNQM